MSENKARFIVLEGLDGTGKSTQIKLLQEFFTKKSLSTYFIHFPRTNNESEIFGEMIAKFLRGDYGDIDSVHPELVALIYAADRYNASDLIKQKITNNQNVIADRYVFSNIAYQCAKIKNSKERTELAENIFKLEYEYFKIPKPDLSIFLHVPINFVEEKLTDSRECEERNYLQGKADIHEKSIDFQKSVENVYLDACKTMPNELQYLNCINSDGKMMSVEQIQAGIISVLKERDLI